MMSTGETTSPHQRHLISRRASEYRHSDSAFASWARGYGVIVHDDTTQVRVWDLAETLARQGKAASRDQVLGILSAADRTASAAMWLTVHMTYADRVRLDGAPLAAEEFKATPEGHTGGALNMVPAYVGYLAINSLTAITRSWLMGQGHSVAGIEACNVVVRNLLPELEQRFEFSDEGLTRFVRDFYSYAQNPDGTPGSPLGSHVSARTAGGISEGGYLGFAELQYVHMPLPGERLVAFLSDGAFEEQRGSDWAPRWWRERDSGLVSPIMILNGRRIEQRSTMAQLGGVEWLRAHLALNGFDPIVIDGRDPAAFAWAIFTMEERLAACVAAIQDGTGKYPMPLHYAIAEAPKGYGFPGEGTNAAHNLPLGAVPRHDAKARERFNQGAQRLWVSSTDLAASVKLLNRHEAQARPRERDHALATRQVSLPMLPAVPPLDDTEGTSSPMEGIDRLFAAIVRRNPLLRPRVGNPDELRSNRMDATLDLLKHRVVVPEGGIAEDLHGGVITALNEEAVVSAALANKGGISLVVSYEAFAVKMLGAIRQEIIFTRHLAEAARPPGWLSVPIISTSHTWENGKNELSHQDPTLAEALLAEMSDTSRVVFPVDWHTAAAALAAVYSTHGQYWNLVVPKRAVASFTDAHSARSATQSGALRVRGGDDAAVAILAIGAYQLAQAVRAAERLEAGGAHALVTALLEPGRFRMPRDRREAQFVHGDEALRALVPDSVRARVIVSHTRPEPMLGALRRFDTGAATTVGLGFLNRGGTLDVEGMLFANRCTWAHIVAACAEALGQSAERHLEPHELAAVQGNGDPAALRSAGHR
jgi:phosphoketolase